MKNIILFHSTCVWIDTAKAFLLHSSHALRYQRLSFKCASNKPSQIEYACNNFEQIMVEVCQAQSLGTELITYL